MTPVATLASTWAVRRRASSSAALAPRHVCRHALERRDTGSNSRGAPRWEGGQRSAAPDRTGGVAQCRDRAREPTAVSPARYTAATQPGQRSEDEHQREVFLLLLHALVVEQLRGGQDLLNLG